MEKIGLGRPHLTDEVAEHLRQEIVSGRLPAGASVRADAVANDLDVSATPVREALHVLRAEGFVQLVPRRGFTVLEVTPDDMQDIFRARALIAGELAARGAQRADDSGVAEMQAALADMLAGLESRETGAVQPHVHRIHEELYRMAASPRLRGSLNALAKFSPRERYWVPGAGERTASVYSRLVSAVADRDAAAARAVMEEHYDAVGAAVAEDMRTRAQPAAVGA